MTKLFARAMCGLFAGLPLLSAMPLPAAAGPSTGQQRSGLSAIDLFALADQAAEEGRIEDAYALYDALANDPLADIRAEARFRKAALLTSKKRFVDAAVELRAILDEMPDATRVRLELARILALVGDEEGARRALRQAQAAGLPSDVAATVEQFARALRSTRPFGGSFELSAAPDSNINRATDARTLDTVIAPLTLSRDARARSGIGIETAGSAYARISLAPNLSLFPRAAMNAVLYRQQAFNDISLSALLGLEWRIGKDRVTPSIGGSTRRHGGAPYARTQTASIDVVHPMGTRAQLTVGASAALSNYVANDLQDGGLFEARLSYERALKAASGIGVTISGSRQAARDPGYSTWSGGLGLLGWRDVGRITLFATVDGRHLTSDDRIFIFTSKRREWLVAGKVGATFRQVKLMGFAPLVRLGFERNFSTVGLYDYRRLSTEIGITRAF